MKDADIKHKIQFLLFKKLEIEFYRGNYY